MKIKDVLIDKMNAEKGTWNTRVSQCCASENNNTDSDICPDCKEHTGWVYLDEGGEEFFND